MELDGKRALITGGTGGIGSATATLLAQHGAEVLLCGRSADRGEQIVAELRRDEHTAHFVAADLERPESVHQLLTEAGDVDILVNNAGVFPIAPTADTDVTTLDSTFATNVRAPFLLVATLAPRMAARHGGAIINISTLAAHLGLPGLAAYSASKAALESLTRTWAAEYGGTGVRVNAIAPGPTRTEAVTAAFTSEGMHAIGQATLLRRTAHPAEMAEVVVFLASDRSSYITGATIAVDGGRTIA